MNKNDRQPIFLKPSFPFSEKVLFEALSKMLSPELIERLLVQTGSLEKRKRCLPARLMVYLVIAMTLYAHDSIPEVLNKLVEGLRFQGAYLLGKLLPVKSAIAQARQRLGVKVLVELFRAVAGPKARANQSGAFYKGMRLTAFDGTTIALPDTLENERFFGRPGSVRGKSAWPLVTVVGLMEIGTKMLIDAFVGRYKISERKAAARMMRSIQEGMLILWDRLYIGYVLWKMALGQGAHLLGRVAEDRIFKSIERFPDGSYLAKFYPSQRARNKEQGGLIVRIIEYTVDGFPGKNRLITSLLDWTLYPALELISLYHERWEIELGFDEIKVHLLGKTPALRSKTPLGCLQETYGLLISYLAIRSLMLEAATKYDLDPDRLSFTHSLRVISRAIPRMQAVSVRLLSVHYEMMLDEIAATILPARHPRINPRVVKQKMSKFPCKRFEHFQAPGQKIHFQEAVHVLN